MKNGPTSAAISARMKAIANPSSVVCTGSPLSPAPAEAAHPHRRYSTLYRDNCGDVTARGVTPSAQQFRLGLPARRQALQAAQHEGRPPFRVLRVIQPQLRQPTQEGRDRDLGLDASELGAEAEVNAAAERQRFHVRPGDIQPLR